MRTTALVLALCCCAPAVLAPIAPAVAPTKPERECASCIVEGPPLGMSNFKQVGRCRYEVRSGSNCCEIRFDYETAPSSPQPEQPAPQDGGFSVVGPIIEHRTFEPSTRRICHGESAEVCGESVKCAP